MQYVPATDEKPARIVVGVEDIEYVDLRDEGDVLNIRGGGSSSLYSLCLGAGLVARYVNELDENKLRDRDISFRIGREGAGIERWTLDNRILLDISDFVRGLIADGRLVRQWLIYKHFLIGFQN